MREPVFEQKRTEVRHGIVADFDAAFAWMAAHGGEFAAFATVGARDPGLPLLAERLARPLAV